ncbi:MAG TPA: hypothetical protein VK569_08960, partial [Bacteroidota bacterium]|nr:hypothetical protein [Bacteroidota bacterium]
MNDFPPPAFAALFKEAVEKCFRQPLERPLSEVESKRFASEILEHTGLVLGWKSLKNYSLYLLDRP